MPAVSYETPLTARVVALRLGVSRSTLDTWLGADEERPLAERRFQFHVYHGRKRLWSEAGFQALKCAIETESQPGGLLGGWRDGSGSGGPGSDGASARAKDNTAAAEAMRKVLGYSHGDVTGRERDALVGIDCGDDPSNVKPEMDPCAPR